MTGHVVINWGMRAIHDCRNKYLNQERSFVTDGTYRGTTSVTIELTTGIEFQFGKYE